MKLRKLILATLATASIGAAAIPASAEIGIWVNEAPPAPRHEVIPAPRAGYVWEPGYYDYRGHHYAWTEGHWVREKHGMFYHPTHWVQRDGRWTKEGGRWDKERYVENHEYRGNGDRDHDGVPNKYDHSPDNPNRR
jgi:hypothetical protein